MAGLMGLEPTTFRVTGERSNQTELQPPHHNTPSLKAMVRKQMAPRAGLEPAT